MKEIVLAARFTRNVLIAPEIKSDDAPLWIVGITNRHDGDKFEVRLERTTHAVRDMDDPDSCSAIVREHGITKRNKTNSALFGKISDAYNGCTAEGGSMYDDIHHDPAAPIPLITISDLVVAVRRAPDVIVGYTEAIEMGSADFEVTVRYSTKVCLQFNTRMPLAFNDPKEFDVSDLRAMRRLATKVVPIEAADDAPMSPPRLVGSFEDRSDVAGDRGDRPVSQVPDVAPLNALDESLLPEVTADSPLNNAMLSASSSPLAKYNALACMLARMQQSGAQPGNIFSPVVSIIGDHPGALGNALVGEGITVVGYDPRNENVTHRGHVDFGAYTQVNAYACLLPSGALRLFDRRGERVELTKGCRFFVVDTSRDDETADAATDRNVRVGLKLLEENPGAVVVVQLRAAPKRKTMLGILDLPGHSNQGCEVYAVLLEKHANYNFNSCPFDWTAFCWAIVEAEADGDSPADGADAMDLDGHDKFIFALSPLLEDVQDVFSMFFAPADEPVAACSFFRRPRGEHDRGPPLREPIILVGSLCHWYQFVVSRAFVSADRGSKSGIGSVVAGCSNPVEVLAAIESFLGHRTDLSPAITNMFDGSRVEALTGVSHGLLHRHPNLSKLIRHRYATLVRLTHYHSSDAPGGVLDLFSMPGSGGLLQKLSALRVQLGEDWDGPIIGRYRRVLPYQFLACVAYTPVFLAVYHYLIACKYGLCKELHAWELQHTLWTLTMHGSDDERFRYIGARIRSAVFPISRSRRVPTLANDDKRDVMAFQGNLVALGIHERYAALDPVYAERAADFLGNRQMARIKPRPAARSTTNPTSSMLGRVAGASPMSRSPSGASRYSDGSAHGRRALLRPHVNDLFSV
jgi:hypothetical protein